MRVQLDRPTAGHSGEIVRVQLDRPTAGHSGGKVRVQLDKLTAGHSGGGGGGGEEQLDYMHPWGFFPALKFEMSECARILHPVWESVRGSTCTCMGTFPN